MRPCRSGARRSPWSERCPSLRSPTAPGEGSTRRGRGRASYRLRLREPERVSRAKGPDPLGSGPVALVSVDRLEDVEHKQDDQDDQQDSSNTDIQNRPPLVCSTPVSRAPARQTSGGERFVELLEAF